MLTRERQIELMELALDFNTKMFGFILICLEKKIKQVKAIKDTAEKKCWERALMDCTEEDLSGPVLFGAAGNPLDKLSDEEMNFIGQYLPSDVR